jgi:hypothetical protein
VHVVRSTSDYLQREKLTPEHMVEGRRKALAQGPPRVRTLPQRRGGPKL